MAERIRTGPAYVFIGDPTQALGAGMTFLGKTRGDLTIAPNAEIAVGRADQSGSTPLASAIFFSGIAPVVTIPFVDEEKDKLNLIYPNSTLENANTLEAIGFGSKFTKINEANLSSLCLLPVRNLADYAGTNGIEDPEAFWFPRVVARDYGQFTFNLPEGDDVLQPHETQFAGLYVNQDQGATAIPESMRVMFQGAPNAGNLTWSLPDLTALPL